jgi:uncharacterized membrane protein YeaQ/YmgE (transglycosylase-associated protein family)
MTVFLSNLIGVVAAFGLMIAGLAFMISPKAGCAVLKRLAIGLIGATIGFSLLRCLWNALLASPFYLVLALAVVTLGAFLVRQAAQPRTPRPAGRHWGAERTPLMPSHFGEEDQ